MRLPAGFLPLRRLEEAVAAAVRRHRSIAPAMFGGAGGGMPMGGGMSMGAGRCAHRWAKTSEERDDRLRGTIEIAWRHIFYHIKHQCRRVKLDATHTAAT